MARKLSLEAINQQIAALQQQAAEIISAEKAEVIGKMKVAIAHYAITAEDLDLAPRATRKAPKAPKANIAEKPKGKAKPGKIKYRDDASHTWSGMGPKPRWYQEALAAGKTEAELRA